MRNFKGVQYMACAKKHPTDSLASESKA